MWSLSIFIYSALPTAGPHRVKHNIQAPQHIPCGQIHEWSALFLFRALPLFTRCTDSYLTHHECHWFDYLVQTLQEKDTVCWWFQVSALQILEELYQQFVCKRSPEIPEVVASTVLVAPEVFSLMKYVNVTWWPNSDHQHRFWLGVTQECVFAVCSCLENLSRFLNSLIVPQNQNGRPNMIHPEITLMLDWQAAAKTTSSFRSIAICEATRKPSGLFIPPTRTGRYLFESTDTLTMISI